MPLPPLPLVPVPSIEVQIPSFDGLRIRGLPERPRDRDGRDAGGRGDALLGRTESRFDPELRERQREAAEGRDRVDDHGRIRGVRGLDDRLPRTHPRSEASQASRILRARVEAAGRAPGSAKAPLPWNRPTMGGTLLQTVPTRFVTERKGTVSRGFRPRRR